MEQLRKIIIIAGARPNFMKIAPIIEAFKPYTFIKIKLLHTGQHYSNNMSDVFFQELGLPKPDISLGIGQLSQNQQISTIISKLNQILDEEQPDAVLVVGDVTSTLSAALATNKFKLNNPIIVGGNEYTHPFIIHVESGLRSYDMEMPEEVNRILTDRISDMLFTTERLAEDNLKKEGITENIYFVGNVMIDSLLKTMPMLRPTEEILNLPDKYVLLTLHRPSNVDQMHVFEKLLSELDEIIDMTIVFPVHPRTRIKLEENEQLLSDKWLLVDPLGYRDFISLVKNSTCVFTDSGGIQEETTVLNVPCITLRDNTERPVTVSKGTNEIVGTDYEKIYGAYKNIKNKKKNAQIPELWDGKAAERICKIIADSFN